MNNKTITVTSPLLPDLNEFEKYLQDIWNKKWLTNNGYYHEELEKLLAEYLGVTYLSLFTNGTLPLITAFQAFNLTEGEVITTPYSFVATTHSIWWNRLIPVFVDIDPISGNINPDKIEAAITEKTVAVMPVHVYGTPCDTEKIQKIAEKHNLKVIYDAAHAFGVKVNGESILKAGDISTLSFHATKVYNTIEGGALICHSAEMKNKIDHLKNFGFSDEITVEGPGINSKMDEIRSAYGLLNLKQVDKAIESRKITAEKYKTALKNVKGIRYLEDIKGVRHNYSYFPIFVNEVEYGMTRDELYAKLKQNNILGRRYFYPLITEFNPYRDYSSAKVENLPIATKIASQVLCLPIYAFMEDENIERVIKVLKER
ncbi:MAG: DegT/DnrJ/EryC1/StrS family aminotransferase [Treponemataceae bacterium]